MSEDDRVKFPGHYISATGMECVDAIRAALTREEYLGWCSGNVIKYLWRWRSKGGVEDLKKAREYLNFVIDRAEY